MNFEEAYHNTRKFEGGYSNHPADKGGATLYGISSNNWPKEFHKLKALVDSGQKDQAEVFTRDFYKKNFWDALDIENITPDMRAEVFDAAVNHGIGNAKKFLANSTSKEEFLNQRQDFINDIVKNDPTQKVFKTGWDNRIQAQKDQNGGSAVNEEIKKPDAFKDFGVTISDKQPNAFIDFSINTDDAFSLDKNKIGELKKSMIDQNTGAPSVIRQIVGSSVDPESRLATLQKYYPDAQPYGENNFIFTSPETKKPTLYNPKGLDIGDVASASREAFITVGGGAGAVLGAVAGPPGVVIGAGLGTGIGSNFWDIWTNLTGQVEDVRGFKEVASGTALETVAGSFGEGIGRGIPVAIKTAIGGAKETSKAIIKQFERFGITPPLSTASKTSTFGRLEAGLSQNIVSSEIMEEQAQQVISQSNKSLNNIISKYGKPKTKQGAGAVIYEATEKSIERIEKTTTDLYEKAYELVGADTPVNPSSLKKLYEELTAELSKAPQARLKTLSPAIEQIKGILADSTDGGIDFQTLRAIRTDIGRNLKDPLSSGATASQNVAMKRVYAALSEDMGNVAKEMGSDAANAISRADTYKRAYETTAAKTLEKILKFDTDEKAYKFAINASKDGGSSLSLLRKRFTQEEWDTVSATVLDSLGKGADGVDFSISRFVSNYNKLAPEARDILFKGGKYKESGKALDDFAELMTELKKNSRFTNTSNTAGAIQVSMLLHGLGYSGAGFFAAGGEPDIKGAGGALLGFLAPRMAAKLITNPEFIKWLAEPVKSGTVDMTAHFSRLIAIGEVSPELREPIQSYINALEINSRDELQK